MVELQLTPAALRDLKSIWHYSVRHWGQAKAQQYLDRLHDAFETIAQQPHVTPRCDHIRPGYRRQLAGQHVLYYQWQSEVVVIVRILHQRMDAARYL
jgi:toxin ParE1/3/4